MDDDSMTPKPPSTMLELFLSEPPKPSGNLPGIKFKADNRHKMLVNFSRKVAKKMPLPEFIEDNLRSVDEEQETDVEKIIRNLRPFFQWIPPSQDFTDEFKKRSDKSYGYLGHVKLAFKRGDFVEALKMCTRAIAHAPTGSCDLASAFYWRALIMYKLNDPLGAVEDLQLALMTTASHDFPENEETALHNLKTTFTRALAQLDEEGGEDSYTNFEGKTKRQAFVQQIFQLKSPNPLAPALADFVMIKVDQIRGRHLVVTKDVPVGTTLLVESPMVSVLDGTLKLNTMHCHHCMKRNLRCIPCPKCIFALFCDENCMAAAHPYHQYECPCLPDVQAVLTEGVTEIFYLSFKLVCILGPEKLYQIFKTNRRRRKFQNETDNNHNSSHNGCIQNGSKNGKKKSEKLFVKGSDPTTGIYEPQSYQAISNLSAIFEPREMFFPLLALMLANILENNCPSFTPHDLLLDPESKMEYRNFLAGRILLHFECFWKNVFSLGVVAEFEKTACDLLWMEEGRESIPGAYEFQQFASRIFSTTSLINHSCDPNVKMFSRLSGGGCSVLSIRSLKAGEELLISYGPLFFAHDRHERQEQLARFYNFECACLACHGDWPGMDDDFEMRGAQFCCPVCAEKLRQQQLSGVQGIRNGVDGDGEEDEEDGQRECDHILSPANNFQCPACTMQYEERKIVGKFCLMKKAALHARHLIETENTIQAQHSLRTILTYFQTNLVQPSFDLIMSQELFCEAIYKIIHFST